MSELAFEELK